jgi:hypothetical protein
MRRGAVRIAWLKLMVFSTAWFIRLCAFVARCLLKCNSPKPCRARYLRLEI